MIFLHIGLHKTASTMLQRKVFPLLNSNIVLYNPPKLTKLLHRLQYRFEMVEEEKNKIIDEAASVAESYECINRNILISNENLSQLCFFQNYQESADLLKRIFPKAHILLFLRYQTDWLLSCYKQSLKMGDWQSIENFFNYRNFKFDQVDSFYNAEGMLHMDIHKANFTKIISLYKEKEYPVNVFFYESFKLDFKRQVDKVCEQIGHPPLNKMYYNEKVNKGMSYLKASILIKINRLTSRLPTNAFINYREARKRHYNIYYNDRLDDLEKRKMLERKKIKDAFYSFIYRILSYLANSNQKAFYTPSMKRTLDHFFQRENQSLLKYLSEQELPSNYISKSFLKHIRS